MKHINNYLNQHNIVKVVGLWIALFVAAPNAFAAESFTVKVYGQGKPIILIPGLMSNGDIWQPVTKQLSQNNQVHVISIAGFAGTPVSEKNSLDNVKEELIHYIITNKLNKPTIIGHSLGGFMAFWLASKHTDAIGSIVSVDGLPFIGPIFTQSNKTTVGSLKNTALMIQNSYRNMTPTQVAEQTKQSVFIQAASDKNQQKVINMARMSDPSTVGNAMYTLMSNDLRDELIHIKSKILLLGATGAANKVQQKAIETLYQQQLNKAKQAKVIMNTRARHFIMLDDPHWLITQINQFINE